MNIATYTLKEVVSITWKARWLSHLLRSGFYLRHRDCVGPVVARLGQVDSGLLTLHLPVAGQGQAALEIQTGTKNITFFV